VPLTLHRAATFAHAWDVAHELWTATGNGFLVAPDRHAVTRELIRAVGPSGVLFDREAVTWAALRDRVLRVAEHPPRAVPSRVAVRLALQDAIRRTPLERLGASARGPGFLTALERALAEIREAGLAATELATRAPDPVSAEIAAVLAAAADAAHPADVRWSAVRQADALTEFRPVVACGIDDLAPSAWSLLRALARVTEVHLVMPYDDARRGHEARHARQAGWGAQADQVTTHRAGGGGRIEDVVFEDRPPVADGRAVHRIGAAGTRGMHRAALSALLQAIRGGVRPAQCALVVPGLSRARDDLDRLLADWEVPARRLTRRRVLETRLGLALVHLLRFSELDRDASGALAALLGWLRSPYSGADPGEVDAFERDARHAGLDQRRELIGRWGEVAVPARRLVAAARDGVRAQLAALVAVGEGALAALPEAPPTHADELDRRALAALAGLAADLHDVPLEDDALPRARGPLPSGELGALIADLTVPDERGPEAGLAVLDYASLRGRVFHTVALCGLDGDGLPSGPAPDALLGAFRAVLPERLVPRAPGTSEARLRFVHALAAATDQVILVRRVADDEGRPVAPSPFWMETCRAAGLDADGLDVRPDPDGEILARDEAGPEREMLRRLALDGLAVPGLLANAAARRVRPLGLHPGALDHVTEISVTGVETFLGCPYGWLHGRYLSPDPLVRPFDPAAEGTIGHEIMAAVYARVAAGPDPGPCDLARLPAYRAALADCLREVLVRERPNRSTTAFDAFGTRLAVHLELLLANEAASGPRMRPVAVEHALRDEALLDVHPPLALTGRLDRLDADHRHAVVVDYKRSGRDYRGTEELPKRLQPPLYGYLAAAERGLESAGGLYVSLLGGRRDGLVRSDADYAERPPRSVDAGEWRGMVDEAIDAARQVAADLRGGRLAGPPSAGCARWCGCGALWR